MGPEIEEGRRGGGRDALFVRDICIMFIRAYVMTSYVNNNTASIPY